MTAVRPHAGLIEDLEREDDQRGYEDEPEAFVRSVRAAIGAIAAGVLPRCGGDGPQHCGWPMIPEGGGRYVCAKCGGTFDTGRAALPEVLPAEAAVIGGGNCEQCGQPVSTLDGRYACNSCGHCN